jgi:hypothetical protein
MKIKKINGDVADWVRLLYEDALREELPEHLRALLKRLERFDHEASMQ